MGMLLNRDRDLTNLTTSNDVGVKAPASEEVKEEVKANKVTKTKKATKKEA